QPADQRAVVVRQPDVHTDLAGRRVRRRLDARDLAAQHAARQRVNRELDGQPRPPPGRTVDRDLAGQLEDARVHDREQRLPRVDRLTLARVPLADLAREWRGHRRAARLLARADRLRTRRLELRLRRLVRGLRLPELDLRHRTGLVELASGLELARSE